LHCMKCGKEMLKKNLKRHEKKCTQMREVDQSSSLFVTSIDVLTPPKAAIGMSFGELDNFQLNRPAISPKVIGKRIYRGSTIDVCAFA